VLADVGAADLTLDPDDVARKMSPRTKVIMPVHYGGQPARMDELKAAAGDGVTFLEDVAHAPGATYRGRPAGSLGDVAAFSLYATKNVTSAEGGVLTTDDEGIAERARSLALHGMSRDAWKRYRASARSWRYEVAEPGYKYNLSDLQAALGASQAARLEDLNARRVRVAGWYDELLGGITEIELPTTLPTTTRHAWHLYVIRIRPEQLTIDRDAFIEELRDAGVATSVHFIPIHHHPGFAGLGVHPGDLRATDAAFERIISLPIYPDLAREEAEYVATAVAAIARRHRR
ncbi:MAG: UDP-4-amino-4,6-dideoxy-N-acetyl-beta-L-altrosamine transaminase, partial [Dehalococcoidia bacterium]|nr:UDP-4-amino-4,6-dideoxy-N-acetyl-beta-L-altrosamine transaminase [Dehalococcoidia bacterium]